MLQNYRVSIFGLSDLKDLRFVRGQAMLQKRPHDASSHGNRGTVNLEGPGVPGKQKARRACVRRAQRIAPSRAREKKEQKGGGYQNAGFGLRGG